MGAPEAIEQYKQRFKPGKQLPTPESCVAIFGFCSEDEEKVKEVQAMMDFRFLSFEKGQYNVAFTYADIKDYEYSPAEWQRVLYNRNRVIVGTPDKMKESVIALAEECNTNEIMVATFTERNEDRLKSYRLLAGLFDLQPAS